MKAISTRTREQRKEAEAIRKRSSCGRVLYYQYFEEHVEFTRHPGMTSDEMWEIAKANWPEEFDDVGNQINWNPQNITNLNGQQMFDEHGNSLVGHDQ